MLEQHPTLNDDDDVDEVDDDNVPADVVVVNDDALQFPLPTNDGAIKYEVAPFGVDHVVVNCRHIVCHIDVKYGQEKLFPDNNISRINVSIGVLPTKRTKNNCSITWKIIKTLNQIFVDWKIIFFNCTWDETVLNDGSLNNNFPNLVGCVGYWVLQYSSNAHCDCSCNFSICCTSDNPQASINNNPNI